MTRSALLKEIQAEDFAVYEAALYLNGHPTCHKAMAYYKEHRNTAIALRKEYESQFGPLTLYGNTDCNCWRWADCPWPWEKEAN